MSYIEQYKQNEKNRIDAARLAEIKAKAQTSRIQEDAWLRGNDEAYRDVKQQLAGASVRNRYGDGIPDSTVQQIVEWEDANQDLMKQAIDKGYWQPADDPAGAMSAVDRMLWDKNEPEREAKWQSELDAREAELPQPGLADKFRGY